MVVLGKKWFLFEKVQEQTCEVKHFDPSIVTDNQVLIVDASIAYYCTYISKKYLLLVLNVINVKIIDKNLLPAFIFRNSGIKVKDIPNIHVDNTSIKYHTIYMQDVEFWIPIYPWGSISII